MPAFGLAKIDLVDRGPLEQCVARCAITVVYDEGEDPITPAHELSLVDIKRFCSHTHTLLFIGGALYSLSYDMCWGKLSWSVGRAAAV